MYNRIQVKLIDKNDIEFDAQVYIMNNVNKFKYPTNKYMKGVALTTAAFYYLNKQKCDYQNFEINVVDALGKHEEVWHKVKLKLSDYPESVQEIINEIVNK